MRTSFPTEIEAVLRLLDQQRLAHALIGGWAVIAWGVVRTSEDIDILVELPAAKRKLLLSALATEFQAEWLQGEPGDPVPGLIRASPRGAGLPVDLLPARTNADIGALDRAKAVPFGDINIPIVAPEDLIAMKLEAGGGQDYEDVRRLMAVIPGQLDKTRLEERCRERKVSDRLALLTKT